MNLFNNLSTLESAGLIQVAKVQPDLEYLFRHSLVQEAAYASLLESDRRRLHLMVGEAIENLYPDRKKELAGILGFHFKEAGEEIRALGYFITAGDEALAVYANREAEIQYRNALELVCCSIPEIARLYSGMGEALYRQSRFDEALESFNTGIKVYQSLNDADGVARLYARLARVQWYADRRPQGLLTCLEGMELVKDAPDSLGKATLIHETARAYYFNGNSSKALPLCRLALALAEKLPDSYLQADALATLGILPGVQPEEALEALLKSVDLAEAGGYLQVAVRAHINLGTMTRAYLADNQMALQHFRRSAELAKMRGAPSEEAIGLTSYISCLFTPGRLQEIENELPRLVALAKQVPDPISILTSIEFIKGVLTFFKGNWEEATSTLRHCLQEYRDQQNHEALMNMLDELSWMMLERHLWGEEIDLQEVDSLIQEAVQNVENENTHECVWVYPRVSVLRARQARLDEADQWLEKARQCKELKNTPWDEAMLSEAEIEIAIARQDWDEAAVLVEKVEKIDQRRGFRTNETRAKLIRADIYLKRSATSDLENAEMLLRQVLTECRQMGIGHYPDLARERLEVIRSIQHAQSLDREQMSRELKKARQVQESLLPENPPELPGWDFSVLLEPAHETSGDFYDFLVLPDGSLGMVIADVTDKGTSAALFMALGRSLWRTFAINHPVQPDKTIEETNQRIVADTHGGLFITLLYGILDPANGDFTYCSAGHLPGLVLRCKDGLVERLERTGIPLGVMEETSWSALKTRIDLGDAVVFYTDGITDAENTAEEDFGMERLVETLKQHPGKTALQIRDALRGAVREWAGSATQSDDITLLVMVREK